MSATSPRIVEDLRLSFRPQRDWGTGRGLFLLLGHYFVGIAAGTWLCSAALGINDGLLVAFGLGALGGIAHLAFLGRPTRFWRMASAWRTSWVARGFIGLTLFLAGGLAYFSGVVLPALDPASRVLGGACALVGALVLMGYMGFVYSASKAIPFWNSALHPALYMGQALRGGVAALLVVFAIEQPGSWKAMPLVGLWLFVTVGVALLFVLELYGAHASGNAAAARSAHEIYRGRLAAQLYAGILVVGIVAPGLWALQALDSVPSMALLAFVGLASAIGDFFMKYSVVRAGIHLPVWGRRA